jgi:arginine decarboxylase
MNSYLPKKAFLTKGVGKHRQKLTSFELALRAAGIAHCNIVRVSSIFPPGCELISKEKGIALLKPGQIIYCVIAENATNEPHRLVASSIGLARPKNKELYGYISEHHSFGEKDRIASDYAEELAAEMLATTLGLPFDPDKSWDEKKEIYLISDKVVRTRSITQTAVGDKNGLWTTAIAACIFI